MRKLISPKTQTWRSRTVEANLGGGFDTARSIAQSTWDTELAVLHRKSGRGYPTLDGSRRRRVAKKTTFLAMARPGSAAEIVVERVLAAASGAVLSSAIRSRARGLLLFSPCPRSSLDGQPRAVKREPVRPEHPDLLLARVAANHGQHYLAIRMAPYARCT